MLNFYSELFDGKFELEFIPGKKNVNLKEHALPKTPDQVEEEKAHVAEYLANGWIKRSISKFGAPTLFVRKKDRKLRWVVDFRKLNDITINITLNMLKMEELRATLTRAKFISKFDLATAFHQLKVRSENTWKLAFFTVLG